MNVFEHPFLSGLLGHEEIAHLLSAEADLAAMLRFEVALAQAQEAEGVIAANVLHNIEAMAEGFSPDTKALKEATVRDGVVVPELLRQMRAGLDDEAARALHFGATSQDVIDTSLAIRSLKVLDLLDEALAKILDSLDTLQSRDGAKTVMAHTRMQAALPVLAARKIASWSNPLIRHRERLGAVRRQVGVLHLGGPVGTLDALDDKAIAVTNRMADALGLQPCPAVRHTERDGLAELASWLSLVTGSLGKAGADIALFAQQEMDEIELSRGGGSSAMPHKVNPVGAEMLVAFARFNATLVGGVHQSIVHENERSGSAWALEWMILPQMMIATGAALRTAGTLLDSITFVGTGQH